ncbi:MAG: hypothetical protein GX568_09965 [Candidatus Gastranaerophilales bacterium]|nr:hypothetical protein [Candidatus Gastranaerophilales bacterium]
MTEEDKTKNPAAEQPQGSETPDKDDKMPMLMELLKRSTGVYNQVIQGHMLDANDIQRIDNVFLSLVILNERNYFENAIRKKPLEKEKFEAYLKIRHKFLLKQFEVMLKTLETKLMESHAENSGKVS